MAIKDNQLHFDVVEITGTDINWRNGMIWKKDISANTTFTFSNVQVGKSIQVMLKNTSGTTAYTVSFNDSNIQYAYNQTTFTISAGKQMTFTFVCRSATEIQGWASEFLAPLSSSVSNLGFKFARPSGRTDGRTVGLINQDTNEVYVWGENAVGHLGLGDSVNRSTPVKMADYFKELSLGGNHSLLLDPSGLCWTVGNNAANQLGDFTTTNITTPKKISSDVIFSKVDAGSDHSLALGTDGKIYGWGTATTGQLGQNSLVNNNGMIRPLEDTIGMYADGTALPVATKAFTLTKLNATKVLMIAGNTAGGNTANTYIGTISGNSITWTASTAYPLALERHSTVLLGDGRVLVTGGITAGTGTTVTNTYFGTIDLGLGTITWDAGTALPAAVCSHTTTLLGDGRVLLMGGDTSGANATTNVTRFLTISGTTITYAAGTVMPVAWGQHATVLLADGRVFFAGGYTTGVTAATYVASISGNVLTYTSTTSIPVALRYHTMHVVSNDRILLIGGQNGTTALQPNYFAYISGTNVVWSPVGSSMMNVPTQLPIGTYWHDSCVMNDGRILIVGGYTGTTTHTTATYFDTLTTPTYTDVYANLLGGAGLTNTGAIFMWGNGANGRLGDNTATTKSYPVSVVGGRSYQSLSTHVDHTLALDGSGNCLSWGLNSSGELGDFTIIAKSSPVSVAGGHLFTKISAGYAASGALKSDGSAWMWGLNTSGQLGLGDITNRSSPVSVMYGRSYVDISVGAQVTHLLQANGAVWGMGYNGTAALGDDSLLNKSIPTLVRPESTQTNVKIFMGNYYNSVVHAGTVTSSGYIRSWGRQSEGQIGNCNAPVGNTSYPHYASIPNRTFIDGASSTYHMLMLASNGELWAAGYNAFGQIGDNSVTQRVFPVSVAGSRSYSYIAAGVNNSAAISDGTLYLWGIGTSGQIGDNTILNKSVPTPVAGTRSYTKVALGDDRAAAIEAVTNTLYTWGTNGSGSLGHNDVLAKSSPVAVAGGRSWAEISVGGDDNMAAIEFGTGIAYCWGYNASGQVGDGTVTTRSSPVSVLGNRSYTKIACGDYHTLAIESSTGHLYAWGLNDSGQLGDGSLVNRSSPVKVASNVSFSQVVAGNNCSMAMTAAGDVYVWGLNTSGELGNRTLTNIRVPTLLTFIR